MGRLKLIKGNYLNAGLIFLGFFILFALFTPDVTTAGKYDRRCWITWSNYMFGNGLWNIYRLDANYLPLYYYFLYLYSLIAGTTENVVYYINSLKYITLFIEFIGVWFVVALVKNNYQNILKPVFLSLLILLNPAFFYDSLLFGQVDGIYSTFLFISVYYGLKRKPGLSLLMLVIAINFKLQAVILLPLVLLINFKEIISSLTIKYLVKILTPAILVQSLIILPFFLRGDLKLLWNVVMGSVGKYPLVSMGAYNIWYLIFDDPTKILDVQGVFGRSYHAYGLIFFVLIAFIILLPLINWNFKAIFKKQIVLNYPVEKLLLIGALLPLIFFYINTQMHARYVHSSIIFAGAYALYTKRYLFFGFLSVAYFLNIEGASHIIKGDILEYKSLFFNPKFVSLLFLITILIGLFKIFKEPALNSQFLKNKDSEN